jgi:mannose-1-phosphate guanylyltransferase
LADLSEWPALVLTAGKATRLRPLSSIRAKAAMPVAGTPLIVRILKWLRAAGIRRVVMNLHHRPETITGVVGDGSAWDLRVRYSWEPEILGSAGGPRRALPLLDAERFLIINGDTLTDCDLQSLAERHVESQALVTMALVAGDVARYGGAVVGDDGYVQGFARAGMAPSRGGAPAALAAPAHRTARREPLAPRGRGARVLHFIGVQAAESSAFAVLPDTEASEIVRTVYPALIAARPRAVAAYVSGAEFHDVGTARDYLETVSLIATREGRPFDRGERARVASDAVVVDSILWDRVTIGRAAHLTRCVVADDVAVPEGARYEDAVLVAGPEGPSVTPL